MACKGQRIRVSWSKGLPIGMRSGVSLEVEERRGSDEVRGQQWVKCTEREGSSGGSESKEVE